MIVQKMDDEEGREDVQGILSFGAKALFENDDTNDIRCEQLWTGLVVRSTLTQDSPPDSDHDVEKLIDRIEQEEPEPPAIAGQQSTLSFGFAKIWEADKNELGEVKEAETEEDMSGYWAERLVRANQQKAALTAREPSGRGVRRKATRKPMVSVAVNGHETFLYADPSTKMNLDEFDSPEKVKPTQVSGVKGLQPVTDGAAGSAKSNQSADSDSDWGSRASKSPHQSSDDSGGGFSDSAMHIDRPKPKPRGILDAKEPAFPFPDLLPGKAYKPKPVPVTPPPPDVCTLCSQVHGDRSCPVKNDPVRLRATRQIILASGGTSPEKVGEAVAER